MENLKLKRDVQIKLENKKKKTYMQKQKMKNENKNLKIYQSKLYYLSYCWELPGNCLRMIKTMCKQRERGRQVKVVSKYINSALSAQK